MKNGLIFTIIASLLIASSFLTASIGLNFVSATTLIVYWFLSASTVALIILLLRKKNPLKAIFNNLKAGFAIGFSNAVSSLTWVLALASIGPSLTAFFLRFTTIFIIALGIIFFKDRMNKFEIIGSSIAILGALLISFKGGGVVLGISLAVLSAFATSISEFFAKVYVSKVDPFSLLFIRVFYTAFFLVAYFLISEKTEPLPLSIVPLVVVGSSLSAVFGYLFLYFGYSKMNISSVAIIRTLEPFIVIVYSLIIFQSLPTAIEIIGGSLIVIGVITARGTGKIFLNPLTLFKS